MIYLVTRKSDDFFLNGEVFEGEIDTESLIGAIVSKSETGVNKRPNFNISNKSVKELGKTWEEAKEKHPEYFL